MKIVQLVVLQLITFSVFAQNEQIMSKPDSLPYYQIPDYPEKYTAETVAARIVDGLGFRYYWATEELRTEDLDFRPSDMARSSLETLEHIMGLTYVIVNATRQEPNDRRKENKREMGFEEIRAQTLKNIEDASRLLKENTDAGLEDYKAVFVGEDYSSEYPFWNLVNGPIADAIWHVGQIISFRRTSGNPMNSKASMFRGRLRE